MIQAADIGALFATMRASYGHLWPHTSHDVPVWLRRFGGFTREDLIRAAHASPEKYPDHSPTIGQFEEILKGPKPRPNTYLPAPNRSHGLRIANYVLLQVLIEYDGVSDHALRNMVGMKNALLEETPDMDDDGVKSMREQLQGLARGDKRAA